MGIACSVVKCISVGKSLYWICFTYSCSLTICSCEYCTTTDFLQCERRGSRKCLCGFGEWSTRTKYISAFFNSSTISYRYERNVCKGFWLQCVYTISSVVIVSCRCIFFLNIYCHEAVKKIVKRTNGHQDIHSNLRVEGPSVTYIFFSSLYSWF